MRAAWCIVALLALTLPAAASAQDTDAVGAAMRRARELMDRGESDAAIAMLEKTVADHPRDDRPITLLAFLLFTDRDEVDRPFDLIYDIVDRYPDDEYARGLLNDVSLALLDRGDPARAREGWRLLRRVEPDVKEYVYHWCWATYRLGERTGASVALKDLIDRFPSYADPHWLLARIHLDEGRAEMAAATYRDLLVQRPGDVSARLALASVLLWHLRDFDAAETEYRSAADLAAAGSPAAREARDGLETTRTQRDLAGRLRRRMGRLGWLLVGLLAAWAIFAGVFYAKTRPPRGG